MFNKRRINKRSFLMYDRFSDFNFKLVSPRRIKKIIEHCALYFVAVKMNKKKKRKTRREIHRLHDVSMYRETFQDKIRDKRSRESNW